jgi:phosphatidylserine/phosphatidylglycerophosphate/cardiolipin synthase-like enzyme
MSKILNCQGVNYYLTEMIDKAKEKIILVSPFLRISDSLIEKLAYASNQRNVAVFLVAQKGQLEAGKTLEQLSSLKNIKIYEKENLHAKCYANEQVALITSLNLYEFSQQNNVEFGVLLDKEKDNEAFEELKREINTLVASSSKHQVLTDNHEKRNMALVHYNIDLVKTRITLLESWRLEKTRWSKESIDYYLNKELITEIAYKQVIYRKELTTMLKERPVGYFEIGQIMELFYFWKNFELLKVISLNPATSDDGYDEVEVEMLETKHRTWLSTRKELPIVGKMIAATEGLDRGWLNDYYYMN